MKKHLFTLLSIGILFMVSLFSASTTHAEVNVNITFPLPALVIPAPPAMVVLPGTYVYYPPDVHVDIFFYRGYWYRPYQGQWYLSASYNGPWGAIGIGRVPQVLLGLPPHYRRIPPGYERMPYGVVRKNWQTWEQERRWDGHEQIKEHRRYEDRGEDSDRMPEYRR